MPNAKPKKNPPNQADAARHELLRVDEIAENADARTRPITTVSIASRTGWRAAAAA